MWVLNAPVGLEYSYALKKSNFITSLSLFAPIIDVGNVINYRIKGTTDSREIQIEEIISPGIYLVAGITRRFPFSVGVGYQANPGRLGAFVAFDLPLFKLK